MTTDDRRRQSEAIIDGLRALTRMTDRPGAPTGLPDFLVIEVRQRYRTQTAYNHRKISTRAFDLDDMAIVLADAGRMMDAEMLTFLGLLRQDRTWQAKPGWMHEGKVIW
jgi:hypothetical protein